MLNLKHNIDIDQSKFNYIFQVAETLYEEHPNRYPYAEELRRAAKVKFEDASEVLHIWKKYTDTWLTMAELMAALKNEGTMFGVFFNEYHEQETNNEYEDEHLMTVDELSVYMGIPKTKIYELRKLNGLPGEIIKKHLYFRKDQIDEWLQSSKWKYRNRVHERQDRTFPEVMNMNDITEYMGVSKSTIKRYMRYNNFPHVYDGYRKRFNKSEVDSWMEKEGIKRKCQ